MTDMFELYNSQRPMYFGDKQGAGQAALLCGSVILPRKVPMEDLQSAANEVLRINNGLRTYFVEKDGKVYEDYKPFEEQRFEVKSFPNPEAMHAWARVYATIPLKLDIRIEGTGVPKSEWQKVRPSAELVKNVVLHESKMFFTKMRYGRLRRKPSCCELVLFELPEASGAIVKMHHVIGDAWSVVLVANQFLRVLKGETPKAYDYSEFVEAQKAYMNTRRFEKDRLFMEEQMKKCPTPTWVWPNPYTNLEASRRTVVMDEDLTAGVRRYAAEHETTPYTIFLTAVCEWMRRKMDRDQFYVGSVLINRAGFKERNTTGMFVRGMPLLMELDRDMSFAEALAYVWSVSIAGIRHQKGYRAPADTKDYLYDVWVSYQDATLDVDPEALCTQYYCNYVIDTTIFSVEDRVGDGRYKLHFDHNCKVSEADVDELFSVVLSVLRDGLADDSRKLGELGS